MASASCTGNLIRPTFKFRAGRFARWRKRIRADVIDELREVLNGDPRRWPDPRKRDLGKPERRKRPRAV